MKRPWFINYWIGAGLWEIVATALYWTLWFTAPDLVQTFPPQSSQYPGYITFEQAFLLADSWLIISSLIFVIGLWKMRDWGLFFALLNAGSLMFLGSMDLLYDLQHSVFVPFTLGGAIELFIVITVFGFNAFNLGFFWKHRRTLVETFFFEREKDKALVGG
jgi:hypothetical protein